MITYIKSLFHICENGKKLKGKKIKELSEVRFYEKGVIKIHFCVPWPQRFRGKQ